MAAGDAIDNIPAQVAASGSCDIKPGAGVEWCVHNIFCGQNCTLYFTDGTHDIAFDSMTAPGAWIGQTFFITSSYYLKITNTSASSGYFGWSGVQTK
jgi:hypothetical protein